MKNVGFYDWKLGTNKPVSWIMIHAPANGGGKSQDMHSALHLGIILSGKHVGKYGNTGLELNSSNIYLTSPWEPHCTLPGSSERDILLINLDDSTLEKFFFIGREKLEKLFFMPPEERMQFINQNPGKTLLIEHALAVFEQDDSPEKPLAMYNAVLTFFISLLPHIPGGTPSGELPGSRLKPALQSLNCKLMSVEDAAGLCNLSVSRFAVLFKEFFGMSFGRYERLFRLNGAKDDLHNGSTLKEAAEKWNFCDKSHLARLLKKYE